MSSFFSERLILVVTTVFIVHRSTRRGDSFPEVNPWDFEDFIGSNATNMDHADISTPARLMATCLDTVLLPVMHTSSSEVIQTGVLGAGSHSCVLMPARGASS